MGFEWDARVYVYVGRGKGREISLNATEGKKNELIGCHDYVVCYGKKKNNKDLCRFMNPFRLI